MEKLLTLADAADRLGVSLSSVSRWVREGKIESQRIGKRCIRIAPVALDRFVDEQRADAITAYAEKGGAK